MLSNYEYSEGSLTFVNEIIENSVADDVADKENQLMPLSRNTIGIIVMDIWGGIVKFVKRGPRNDRQTAYFNLRRIESSVTPPEKDTEDTASVGLTLCDMSLPQGWVGEAGGPSHFSFFPFTK